LELLDVSKTKLRDSACKSLAAISTLRELHMGFSEVSATGFAHLAALPCLQRIEAEGAKGSGAPAALAPLRALRWLSLAGSALKPADGAALAKLEGCPFWTSTVTRHWVRVRAPRWARSRCAVSTRASAAWARRGSPRCRRSPTSSGWR
jgi:hypothetical protein